MKHSYRQLPKMIQQEIWINVLAIFGASILTAFITKMTGTIFNPATIAVLMVIGRMDIIPAYLIKKYPMWLKHRLLLITSTLQVVTTFSFFYIEQETFIYIYTVTTLLEAVTLTAFYIDYDTVIIRMINSPDTYRDLQYMENIAFKLASALGLGLVALTDMSCEVAVVSSGICMAVLLGWIIRQHVTNYSNITIEQNDVK